MGEEMKRILAGFCLLLLLTVPSLADNVEDQALATARQFAELINAGNYAAAYWSASPLLQLANAEDDWLDQVERRHKVLGRVLERSLHKTRMVDSLAYLPDDNYQIIVFASRTERKAKAIETLILHKVNGIWQVCCYKFN